MFVLTTAGAAVLLVQLQCLHSSLFLDRPPPPQNVLEDAGSLCDKAVVLGAVIKEGPYSLTNPLQSGGTNPV